MIIGKMLILRGDADDLHCTLLDAEGAEIIRSLPFENRHQFSEAVSIALDGEYDKPNPKGRAADHVLTTFCLQSPVFETLKSVIAFDEMILLT